MFEPIILSVKVALIATVIAFSGGILRLSSYQEKDSRQEYLGNHIDSSHDPAPIHSRLLTFESIRKERPHRGFSS